jgi:hypothetical protein
MADLVRYKYVDPEDPRVKEIAEGLKVKGYEIVWKSAREEARLVNEGWEYVIDEQDSSRPGLKIRESSSFNGPYMILLKRRLAA